MQKKALWIGLAFVLASSLQLNAQSAETDNAYKKWYVGSTLYLLGNFVEEHNPEYIQLNVGYRITPKDVVSFRFKRSVYDWPLGTPWRKIFDETEDTYPGHARIIGPALGYQRFWWKGVYTSLYAMSAFEKYYDENNKEIGNGYTLYLDTYIGYQFKFFKNRFFCSSLETFRKNLIILVPFSVISFSKLFICSYLFSQKLLLISSIVLISGIFSFSKYSGCTLTTSTSS